MNTKNTSFSERSAAALSPSERTTLRRRANRSANPEVFDAVLRDSLICHVAVIVEGSPAVLPTSFVRVGDEVFLHGAVSNHLLRSAANGPVCFTATLADGLVFAKSAAHHSMNYRCVVAFGVGRDVVDLDEKDRVLTALLEKMRPGRSCEARAASDLELASVRVVAISLDEASCKMREGPPNDDDSDLTFNTWRGVARLHQVVEEVIAC